MINSFEEYTFELNQYEREELLPLIVLGLSLRIGKQNAITNNKATTKLREKGLKINAARFRKIVQYIRFNGIIHNLIACKKGYYISIIKKEQEDYILSLEQRISSLKNTLYALQYQSNI
jgi:hypothetical protein